MARAIRRDRLWVPVLRSARQVGINAFDEIVAGGGDQDGDGGDFERSEGAGRPGSFP